MAGEQPPYEKLSYGQSIANYATVNYRCLENHFIIGQMNSSICISGHLSSAIPDCEALCSSREVNTYTIQATDCVHNSETVRCTDAVRPGTTAQVSCRQRYEKTGRQVEILTCNAYGVWSPRPFSCTAICGEEASDGVAYIVGGYETDINKVPWHATIYKKSADGIFSLQCGGTILNARVVVSAMHCFWDVTEDAPYADFTLFRVVVGKATVDFYNNLEARRPQYFEIDKIHYDKLYSDRTGNYASDVVLIVLRDFIIFQSHIAPICIPYELENENKIVPAGLIGRVSGFGLTMPGGEASSKLKIVELPAIERAECRKIAENDQLLTDDKFCAGYVNLNVSVCQGDSGGGLVFPQADRWSLHTKYYIRGIVSTGPGKDWSCDSNKYTTFTNILYHKDLLRDNEVPNRPM